MHNTIFEDSCGVYHGFGADNQLVEFNAGVCCPDLWVTANDRLGRVIYLLTPASLLGLNFGL